MSRFLNLAVLAAVLSTSASAGVITFGNTVSNPIVGSYAEGGFTFQVVTGTTWGISTGIGNPGSALFTGSIPPAPGDRIDIFLTAGGLFTFSQFDYSKFDIVGPDIANIFGEVSSVTTQQLLNVGSAATVPYNTASTGFSAPVDRVRIVIASVGGTSLDLDNLVLTGVPEPAVGLFVPFGIAAMWACRRRRAA